MAPALIGLLAACGAARAESGGFFKNMFGGGGGGSSSPGAPKLLDPNEAYCPPVAVGDGGAAIQSFAGAAGDRNALRHQIVFGELSRECAVRPDGTVGVKVGAVLRALLGPAGAPGRFEAPFIVSIKYNEKTVTTRSRRVAIAVPSGAAQGTTSIIEDGLIVPADMALGYEIEVAIAGSAGRARPPKSAGRRAKPPSDEATATGGEAQAPGQ